MFFMSNHCCCYQSWTNQKPEKNKEEIRLSIVYVCLNSSISLLLYNHGVTEWFKLDGTLKLIIFHPLLWVGTPSIRPSCSKPYPTRFWTFSRMRQPENLAVSVEDELASLHCLLSNIDWQEKHDLIFHCSWPLANRGYSNLFTVGNETEYWIIAVHN